MSKSLLLAYAHKEEGASKEAAIQEIRSIFQKKSLNNIETNLTTIAAIANYDDTFSMNHMTALDIYTAINYEQEVEKAKAVDAVIPETKQFYEERALADICECLLHVEDLEFEILSKMIA